jgi:hypothetical protein
MRINNGRAQRCRASQVIPSSIRDGSKLGWRSFGGVPERGSINWTDYEQRWHHILPIVHLEAFDGVGLGLFDLTLKTSHAVGWRGDCAAVSVTDNRIGYVALLGSFSVSFGSVWFDFVCRTDLVFI